MRASVLRSVRLLASLAFLALWAAPVRAQSAASQYVGRPIEDIRLFVENRPTTEAAIVDLIAVKTGEALSIAAVRESIAHIYSLGRFQDVQVEGAQAPGGGVALRFNLIPFHSIQRIDFTGTLGLSSGELRSAVVDRYGASPPIGRVDAAVRTLQQLYADRGYLRAKVEASSQILHDPDRALLTFTIDAGPRATIGRVVFERDPSVSREEFLRRIGAVTGEVFLRPRLQERLDDYVRRLKERRFYEADGSFQAVESEDGRTVDLVIAVRSGLPVSVRFDFQGGDPVPSDRLKELAPIEREGSVDEDLLEDSEARIENYLRQQGYWKADVTVRAGAVGHGAGHRLQRDPRASVSHRRSHRDRRHAGRAGRRGGGARPAQAGRALSRIAARRQRGRDSGVLPPARLRRGRRQVGGERSRSAAAGRGSRCGRVSSSSRGRDRRSARSGSPEPPPSRLTSCGRSSRSIPVIRTSSRASSRRATRWCSSISIAALPPSFWRSA